MAPESLNVKRRSRICSSRVLDWYLDLVYSVASLGCRVDGDTDASALTKIEAAVSKLGKVIEARKKTLAQAAAGSLASSTVGAERCSVNKISCLQPRGTFDFTLGHTGLELCKSAKDASAGSTGASPELCVRWDQVSCVLRFPRPDPYKSDKVSW